MSNAVLPSLPGLMWDVVKTPQWNTFVNEMVSGKEARATYWSAPRRRWTLKYDTLRQGTVNGTAWTELATLAGFYNSRQGRFDSFLYSDPSDSSVTAEPFGTGDGSTTAFQLIRAYGGFTENIYDLNGAPSLYRNDWQGNQLLVSTARTNLLLYSEQLDNAAWTKAGATISANVVAAPDGNTTADKIAEDTSTGPHYALQTVGGLADNAVVTASVYVKAAERTWVTLHSQDKAGTAYKSYFNLGAGTFGTVASGHTVTATAMSAAGWYRLTWRFAVNTGASAPGIAVETATGDGQFSYLGTTGSGLYAWGAQLEVASAATSYLQTTSATVTRTDYTLSSTGLVTLAVAPLTGAALTWTGAYYFRVRFDSDAIEFTNFLAGYWHSGAIAFVQVK